ncbi:helix-turn-helix domain-containing protein [Thermohalobacter berrensis]|uniref:DNA-binding protein n=1 Tax=Thermohalobacter berrensis TaxID=99594 RepID=A0A419SXP2_9FIRM|nr:XRE family transcriptional regulator [Thermohalobacter berrensis]RKD30017.1 DNA-binding protein [Thermohalobacter berrensis]
MDNFNLKIGKKLNHLRKKKGYSLSELEEISGISKSMLGQIERGESNPTIKTLWKIAKSLNVNFSFFIDEDTSTIGKITPESIVPIKEKENMYRVYPLVPFNKDKGFEIYMIEIEPGYSYKTGPHNIGVEEYAIVSEGILEVTVDDEKITAKEGEIIYFKADKTHIYCNKSNCMLKAYVLIYYS